MGLRLVMCLGSLSCLGIRVTRPTFCLGRKELSLRQLLIALVTRSPIWDQKTLQKAGVMPVTPGALSLDMDLINSAISGLVMGRSRDVFSYSVTFASSIPSMKLCRSEKLSLHWLLLNRELQKLKIWLCTVVWSLLRVGDFCCLYTFQTGGC